MFFLAWLPLVPEMTVCLTIIITVMFSIIKTFFLCDIILQILTYFDSKCYLLNIMMEVVLFSA